MSEPHEGDLQGQAVPIAAARVGLHPSEKVGVVYVAYGVAARREATESIESLRKTWPEAPVVVIGENVSGANEIIRFPNRDGRGRWAKVNLDCLSPFDQTLYLDADTRVHGDISVGFDILADGWDWVTVASKMHGTSWLWHVLAEERGATQQELGGQMLTLGGGVFWFARNERVARLFARWREEWQRWQGQDQAALLRAYVSTPCKIWLLDRSYNSGTGPVVKHRFGKAKAKH